MRKKKSAITLAASLAFVFLTAEDCSVAPAGDLPSGSGPKIPRTCVIKPDEPHNSKTSPGEIVGKGWFNCSVPLQDATLDVELERRNGSDWAYLNGRNQDFGFVHPSIRYRGKPVPTRCVAGIYRTSVRLIAHDTHGHHVESPHYYSRAKPISC